MESLIMPGQTRVLGGPEAGQPEYRPLSVQDIPGEVVRADGMVQAVNCQVTAWRPTPEELERLNQGAPIYLSIMGTAWPPVNLFVAEPAEG